MESGTGNEIGTHLLVQMAPRSQMMAANTNLILGKRKRGFTSCEDMAALSPPISESKDKGNKKEKSQAHLDTQSTPYSAESIKLMFKRMFEQLYSSGRAYRCYMEDVIGDQNTTEYRSPMASLDDEPYLLERYENFKKYDIVKDHSDHLIGKRLQWLWEMDCSHHAVSKELEILKNQLPGTERIYVRVYGSTSGLLRAAIIGADGTPYHDGLFYFDMCIPQGSQPPSMRYHSAGFQIHPNIFKCGEVCYRLYKSSSYGSFQWVELWVSGDPSSNMLQVLVTIRDVILNENPLFNSAGYVGSRIAEETSLLYNENIIIKSLKTMVHVMNKPPKHFEDFVVGHFRSRARRILMKCKAYMEGKFLEGKVEDRCSITFRNDVASCIKPLVEAFIKIGAKEAQFLPDSSCD